MPLTDGSLLLTMCRRLTVLLNPTLVPRCNVRQRANNLVLSLVPLSSLKVL